MGMRNYIGIGIAVAVGVTAAVLVLSATGVIGEDDEPTTVVREVPSDDPPDAATDDVDAPIENPSNQEPSGPCEGSREATATRTGYADIQVTEAPCDYAVKVATVFADAYGPECFQGCTKLVVGIRCETQPPVHAEVVCSAARTEVRFSISGAD